MDNNLLPDDYGDDDATFLLDEGLGVGERLQLIADYAANHPHIACGGGTLFVSLAIDLFVRFDPLVTALGLAAAITLGWKGEEIIGALVPGADHEQAREDTERFANHVVGDYPVYADQRPIAKLRRLFKLEQGELVDTLPDDTSLPKRGAVKKVPGPRITSSAEALTQERIAMWFEQGLIDNTQFFTLLERIDEGPKTRHGNGYGNDATDEREEATEEAVSPQNAPLRLPNGWTEAKVQHLIGAFLAIGRLDDSLKAIDLSTSQRNRDFARILLKQQGLWKDAR